MMKVITARNVNDALPKALVYIAAHGTVEASRIGGVRVAPGPVATEYSNPVERVLLSPIRDANPFFHFMEGLWMINGGDDVAWPASFNKRFGEYSTNGLTLHGAYGHRWRDKFGVDQLKVIVRELQKDNTTRRAVLQMWSAAADLFTAEAAKDTPCNTHAYFDVRGGKLNMTVCCRSNDAVWGAYGANVVHFSMLQEVMAAMVGVEVGVYTQFSNNLHVYEGVLPTEKYHTIIEEQRGVYPGTTPMVDDADTWLRELALFIVNPDTPRCYREAMFRDTAVHMYTAWNYHKTGARDNALGQAKRIAAPDWQAACVAWLERRYNKADTA